MKCKNEESAESVMMCKIRIDYMQNYNDALRETLARGLISIIKKCDEMDKIGSAAFNTCQAIENAFKIYNFRIYLVTQLSDKDLLFTTPCLQIKSLTKSWFHFLSYHI